jgi:hypothetical protein
MRLVSGENGMCSMPFSTLLSTLLVPHLDQLERFALDDLDCLILHDLLDVRRQPLPAVLVDGEGHMRAHGDRTDQVLGHLVPPKAEAWLGAADRRVEGSALQGRVDLGEGDGESPPRPATIEARATLMHPHLQPLVGGLAHGPFAEEPGRDTPP